MPLYGNSCTLGSTSLGWHRAVQLATRLATLLCAADDAEAALAATLRAHRVSPLWHAFHPVRVPPRCVQRRVTNDSLDRAAVPYRAGGSTCELIVEGSESRGHMNGERCIESVEMGVCTACE